MFTVHETDELAVVTATGDVGVSALHRAVIAELEARGALRFTRQLHGVLGSNEAAYPTETLAYNIQGVLEDREAPTDLAGWVQAIADEFEANQNAFCRGTRLTVVDLTDGRESSVTIRMEGRK